MPSALVIFPASKFNSRAGRRGRPERAGGAGGMEAADLVGVLGRVADPDHGLGSRDEAGEKVAAGEPALLGHRKRGAEHRGAGVRTGVRLGQAVELEGMGHGAIGERRGTGMHGGSAGAEDVTLARRAVLLRIGDDHLAPRQFRAVDDRRHRIRHAILGALHHRGRQILEPHRGGVGGEPFGLVVGFLVGSMAGRLLGARRGHIEGGRGPADQRRRERGSEAGRTGDGRHLLEKGAAAEAFDICHGILPKSRGRELRLDLSVARFSPLLHRTHRRAAKR